MKFHHYLLGRKIHLPPGSRGITIHSIQELLHREIIQMGSRLTGVHIRHCPHLGSHHALADYLSHLEVDSTDAIPNDLPDSAVLTVTPEEPHIHDPDFWLNKTEHYLYHGVLSPQGEGDAQKSLHYTGEIFPLCMI